MTVLSRVLVAACLLAAISILDASPACAMPAEGVAPVNNRAYAPAVRQLIRQAGRSIHIMLYQARYYEEHPDSVTNRILEDLIDAAQRGVDVRILIDTGSWQPEKNAYNLAFVDRLTTAGVQVWEDDPEDVSHQKVMLVDDEITLVGSLNWTHYSVSQNNEVAVIVYSRPLNEWFRGYFAERLKTSRPYSNVEGAPRGTPRPPASAQSSTTPALSARGLPGQAALPAIDVKPIANRDFYPAVHEMLLAARQSIDVVQRSINLYTSRPRRGANATPTLPGEPPSLTNALVDSLAAAQRRGVRVRVVLDKNENFDSSSNDETAQYLKDRGVEVFQDSLTTQTHAKMLLVDDDKVVVGSTNWTYEALEDGNEASVLITSREANKVYKNYVSDLLQSAVPYQLEPKSVWDVSTTGSQRQ